MANDSIGYQKVRIIARLVTSLWYKSDAICVCTRLLDPPSLDKRRPTIIRITYHVLCFINYKILLASDEAQLTTTVRIGNI